MEQAKGEKDLVTYELTRQDSGNVSQDEASDNSMDEGEEAKSSSEANEGPDRTFHVDYALKVSSLTHFFPPFQHLLSERLGLSA